jgi:alkylhydroperoxidase/carboxymuconolactone decarboxylase family protein YurZ
MTTIQKFGSQEKHIQTEGQWLHGETGIAYGINRPLLIQVVIPQRYREMMMLASAAAVKCPCCQTYHREVSKMWNASNEELNELTVIVATTTFWSNILHTQNYDYDAFVRETDGRIHDKEQKQTSSYFLVYLF